jgi:hypothetical protein
LTRHFNTMLHDPSVLGWLTTGMYVAAAWLCAMAAASKRSVFRFWIFLTIALIVLAVNKQLDLQTTLIDALRSLAERDGWYGQRRLLQATSVVICVAIAITGVWMVKRISGERWREHRAALAGVALLAIFLLLRVADIQRLGDMTGLPLSADGVRTAIEWLGLAAIALGARRVAME